MFRKNCIGLVYRVICLCTFVFVIIFSKSIVTLAALTLFFFFITKSDNDFLFIFFYLVSLLFFAIGYLTNNYLLIKIINVIEFGFYFLNIPHVDKVIDEKVDHFLDKRLIKENSKNNKKEKGDAVEKEKVKAESEIDYLRFRSLRKTAKVDNKSDLLSTLYLAIHLFVLFVSIAIG